MAPNVFIYRLGSATNALMRPPRFYRSSDLGSAGCNFASVYAVPLETATSIEKAAKTCQGFKGTVWSQRLWVDFDTEEAARAGIAKLKGEGYDFVVYTTGNRGCHVGIARDAEPSHLLPQQDKAWVFTNLDGADLSLYWHLHLIRLPGAIHEKTGKPKRLIETCKGRSLQLPEFQEEANPNVGTIRGRKEHTQTSIFTSWEVMENLMPTGERKQLVRLAAVLARKGADKAAALWVVEEVNRGFDKPRSNEELVRILNWAYNEN